MVPKKCLISIKIKTKSSFCRINRANSVKKFMLFTLFTLFIINTVIQNRNLKKGDKYDRHSRNGKGFRFASLDSVRSVEWMGDYQNLHTASESDGVRGCPAHLFGAGDRLLPGHHSSDLFLP